MFLRQRRVVGSYDGKDKRRHYDDSSCFGDDVIHVISLFGIRLFVASFGTVRVLLRQLCQYSVEGLISRAAAKAPSLPRHDAHQGLRRRDRFFYIR
jgi:hypothetical protein